MSILSDFEEVRKRIGDEKYNAIDDYLKLNPDLFLDNVLYRQSEWEKFEEWYNKKQE
jgi:hypothetical protein